MFIVAFFKNVILDSRLNIKIKLILILFSIYCRWCKKIILKYIFCNSCKVQNFSKTAYFLHNVYSYTIRGMEVKNQKLLLQTSVLTYH